MPWQEADFPWRDLPTFNTVLMKNTISYKGGLKASSSATAASAQQSETKFKGPLTRKVDEIGKTAVRETKNYYGVTINRDVGIRVDSTSGSSAIFNGDRIELGASSDSGIYFDVLTGKYRINGTLEAVDGHFDGTVLAENIDTTNAKISVAQIEELHVGPGGNVILDPTATISWEQVTDQPYIPQTASDLGALTSQQLYTTLGQNYVVTGKIFANQLNGGVANLTDSVTIGTPNLDGDKSINFENLGNPVATIYKNRNGELSIWCDNKIRLSGYNGTQIAGAVGFFNQVPIQQQTATRLPDTATLADVIIKINGILGKLKNYGLLDIID